MYCTLCASSLQMLVSHGQLSQFCVQTLNVFRALQEPKRGAGTSAVFIARNRFAVLDKGSNQIVIKNLNNEITKKAPSPCATTDAIFYAGTGTLLCRSEDKVRLCIRSCCV